MPSLNDSELPKMKVLLAGAIPPPIIGPTLANKIILDSKLTELVELTHVDTSLNRDFGTLGRFSITSLTRALFTYLKIITVIFKVKPDLLYLQCAQSTVAYFKDSIYVLIAKLFGLRVVAHLRGSEFKSWYEDQNFLVKLYVRYIQAKIDRQLVLGECLKYLYEEVMPPERISVVPNGKDLEINESQNYFLSENEREMNILFLANLKKRKGILEFLEAAKILIEKSEKELAFIVAGASRDAEVESYIENLLSTKFAKKIVFVGQVNEAEKRALLAKADVFVFPPQLPEGHPWVILEALAAGLPVIATDQGAISESVRSGVNGFLTVGTPEDIAKHIEFLYCPELRMKFSKMSRKIYVDEFTESRLVDNLVANFESLR
ncbi:glycosyltransferase family 4 protein [uncultured Pseudoteredinibacter sp.]|uniref:glycosyltransferase family 4 protein n=1 Tax=uncultured Pseudoteredinibacter sp. TaxID=1641701 RepID=UPI002638A7A6|nr:glycosyltransferase family 4 protein [uncultured Pseudoteredinibacter sp.]